MKLVLIFVDVFKCCEWVYEKLWKERISRFSRLPREYIFQLQMANWWWWWLLGGEFMYVKRWWKMMFLFLSCWNSCLIEQYVGMFGEWVEMKAYNIELWFKTSSSLIWLPLTIIERIGYQSIHGTIIRSRYRVKEREICFSDTREEEINEKKIFFLFCQRNPNIFLQHKNLLRFVVFFFASFVLMLLSMLFNSRNMFLPESNMRPSKIA